MDNACEAFVAACLIDLCENSGILSHDEAQKVYHKIFQGKDVMNYDCDYQTEPVA